MGEVLFILDNVPDPLEEISESITEAPAPIEQEQVLPDTAIEPVAPVEPAPAVSGGEVLFELEPEPEREPSITEQLVVGVPDLALTVVSGMVAEVAAGLSGIIATTPFFDEGAGAETVEFVRDLAFKPGKAGQAVAKNIGEVVESLTPDFIIALGNTVKEGFKEQQEEIFQKYGAAAATAFGLVPPVVLQGTSGYLVIKQMRKVATTRADEAIQQTEDALREKGTTTFRTDIQPEDKTIKQIVDDFDKRNKEDLIADIQPDAEILQSAKDLGVDLNPSHYSNNLAFVQVEQGLKSKPGSQLGKVEREAIEKLGDEADKLIIDMGGAVEKGLLDQSIKNRFEKTIAKLDKTASEDYAKINAKIPKSVPVVPGTSRIYIEGRLEDLGGDASLLSKSEKQLAGILGLPKKPPKPGVEEVELPTPSYGALDQVRRNVGTAIEKKTGPYKDDEEFILDQVYGSLINDQQGVADAFGVGPLLQKGRKVVKLNKELQKKSLALFGREINGSLIPKLSTAAKSITKGDISQFNKLMKALPPSQRQAASATMLNDFFAMNVRGGKPLGGGFVGAFDALNRNPGIKKIIFDQLPKEALKRFDDIGRVTTGLFRAKALQNNSGTANAILANLDNGAIANKLLKSRRLFSPFSIRGRVLGFTAGVLKRNLPPKTEIANELLSSPAFRKSVEDAALGKAVSAEKITDSKVFKDWQKFQSPPDQKQIAAIGFIPWLLQEEEDDVVDIEVSTEELRRRQ